MPDAELEVRRGVGVKPGQFGHKAYEDQGDEFELVHSTPPQYEDLLDDKYYFVYVAQDDELPDDVLNEWLGAKSEDVAFEVADGTEEFYADARYEGSREAAIEALRAAHEREHPEDAGIYSDHGISSLYSADVLDCIREEIDERQADDAVWSDLVRNTPDKFVRAPLGIELPSGIPEDEVPTFAREIAEAAGIDYDTNRDKLDELVSGSQYSGGQVCVFWTADVGGLTDGGRSDVPPSTVSISNPTLLVLNSANGSGYEVDVQGEFTKNIDRFAGNDGLVLDNAGGGYGWDEVCGLVKSAYRPASVSYGFDR